MISDLPVPESFSFFYRQSPLCVSSSIVSLLYVLQARWLSSLPTMFLGINQSDFEFSSLRTQNCRNVKRNLTSIAFDYIDTVWYEAEMTLFSQE